jgi:hypothetical protein
LIYLLLLTRLTAKYHLSYMPAKSQSPAAFAPGQPKPGGPQLQNMSLKTNKPQAGLIRPPRVHHSWVEALINPFDNFEGVQLPDEFNGGSMPHPLITEYTVSSDAAGYVFETVTGVTASYRSNNVVTAGVLGSNVNYVAHPESNALDANYANFRVLIIGVEVTYIGNVQQASGRVALIHSSAATTYAGTAIADCFDDTNCSGRAVDGYRCVLRPNQSPRFEPNGSGSALINLGALHIVGAGLPSSQQVFSVRVTIIGEGLPKKSSVLRELVSSEPHDMHALSIGSNIGSSRLHGKPNTPHGQAELKSEGRALADSAWQMIAAAAPSFGVPPALAAMLPSLANKARDYIKKYRRST